MIGGAPAGFEDLDVAAGLFGDAHEHVDEVFAGDVARAAARDQDAARFEHVDGQAIEPVIGPQGFVHRAAAAGELGGIENHAPNRSPSPARFARALKESPVSKRTLVTPFNSAFARAERDRFLAGVEAQHLSSRPMHARRSG